MINKVVYSRSKKNNKKPSFYYKDVEYDNDGWADAKKFLPLSYDLVFVKIKNKNISSGWSNGFGWDGISIKPEDEVLFWKRA